MTSPGILLFGERLPELQAVTRAIVSPSSTLSTTATAATSSTTQQWTIDNKYYTAQLVINMLTTEQHVADLPSLIDHQAVVAVFNAATATLPQVRELWTAAENHNINYEIKMVVALCTDCSARPEWLDEADAWCTTRLAEFVIVEDLGTTTAIESIPAAERRDEDGLQRVIEALQAHMWPGMQRKSNPPRNTLPLDFVDDDDEEEEGDRGDEPSVEALLQAALRVEENDDDDGTDEFDKVFAEVIEFRQSMAGASRIQRADAAAEIVTRLQALMGGDESDDADADKMNQSQEESVDCSSSDDNDDVDTPLPHGNGNM